MRRGYRSRPQGTWGHDQLHRKVKEGSHASLSLHPQSGVMRNIARQPKLGAKIDKSRWATRLALGAQLLGDVAVGIVAGASGVYVYDSVRRIAWQRGEVALRSLHRATHENSSVKEPHPAKTSRRARLAHLRLL